MKFFFTAFSRFTARYLSLLLVWLPISLIFAQDTWVFTFNYATTSKKNLTWNSRVTKNGVAQNDVVWNHSANASSYTQSEGCSVTSSAITISSSISINYIKSVTINYTSEYSGHTIKMSYLDPLTTTGFVTYNDANQFYSNTSVPRAYSSTALTANIAEENTFNGYIQFYLKGYSSTKKIFIQSVTITTYAAPLRTVSFDCHGLAPDPAPITEVECGEGVRLPGVNMPLCGRWQFVGWLFEPQTETVTSQPPLLKHPGSIYKPNQDITLHALYKKDGAYVPTSTQYIFSKSEYTLMTEKGTWEGPTPTYLSAGTGVGWSSDATIVSPRSYSDITQIHVKGNLERFWATGDVKVYVDNNLEMTYSIRPDHVELEFDVDFATPVSGNVKIEFLGFTGVAVAIDYIEVYYSDYVGYFYSSVPECPEDITPKVLWGQTEFTLEGATSGSITLPLSSAVEGVRDNNLDILTFSAALPQGEVFELIVDGGEKTVKVPAIVSSAKTSVTTTADEDIVILPGAKLTLWSGTINARNLYIYRRNDVSGQLDMRGGNLNLNGESMLVLTINPDRYYFFGTPYQSALADAHYLNGAETNYNTSSSSLDWWIVQNYDGERRAAMGYDWNNWQGIKSLSTILNSGEGHAIGIDIVGKPHAQRSYVFPFESDLSTENSAKQIAVSAHVPTSGSAFDEGWNFLSNPYLHNIKGAGASLPGNRMLYFVLPVDGTDQRFSQRLASEVTSLSPFSTFFVQVRGSADSYLTLGSNGARAASAPRRSEAVQNEPNEIDKAQPLLLRLNIISPDNDRDHATFVVDDDFSASELVIGEDQDKLGGGDFIQLYAIENGRRLAFDAISKDDAVHGTLMGFYAPLAGEYRLEFEELNDNLNDIAAVYLTDLANNTQTNLLDGPASFSTETGANNGRFSVRVEFKSREVANDSDEDMSVRVIDGQILIDNIRDNNSVSLFSSDGKQLLHEGTAQGSWRSAQLPQGTYIIRVGDKSHKVVL